MMNKVLVAYFSASGVTADAAKKIAQLTNAPLYEIRPALPYTPEDLDWRDQNSRSSIEMKDKSSRPEIADKDAPVEDCTILLLGFPIWWYTAPTLINTFLENYDFSGKRIILFATSGSSGFGSALADLKSSLNPQVTMEEGIVVHGIQSSDTWRAWVASLGIGM